MHRTLTASILVTLSSAVAQRGARAEPTLDGTNAKTFAASLAKVESRLRYRDRAAFTTVMRILQERSPSLARMREGLHGDSAENILRVHENWMRQFDRNGNRRLDAREIETMEEANGFAFARRRNENTATLFLQGFVNAQNAYRDCNKIDLDGDGHGEYAFLAELSGNVAARARAGQPREKYRPVYITRDWELTHGRTQAVEGYLFQVFLPGRSGVPRAESANIDAIDVSPDDAEQSFCIYAWPVEFGRSGNLVFFVSQAGKIMCAPSRRISGRNGPTGNEALPRGTRSMVGLDGRRRIGNDGSTWKPYDPNEPYLPKTRRARPGRSR